MMLKWLAYSYILLLSIGFGLYYTLSMLDGVINPAEVGFVGTYIILTVVVLMDLKRDIDEA